ncbi:hypothetical protein SDJN03_16323, partial [Cucurbita argyrosperma subsp. sororia]
MAAISLLGRLRKSVKKLKLMMNFKVQSWRLAAMFGRSLSRSLRVSFKEAPGLKGCREEDVRELCGESISWRGLQRTRSYASEDDVDMRAEAFIANFYHHLRIERQVLLDLQYCRRNSFKQL